MKPRLSPFFQSAAAALVCLSSAAFAADVVFGPATTIAADTDILNVGGQTAAYNWSNTNIGLNNVLFTGTNVVTGSPVGGGVTLSSNGPLTSAPGSFVTAATPYGALSASYRGLLSGQSYRDAAGATITTTMNNLIVGHTYAVQTWASDPRAGTGSRSATIEGGSNTVTLDYNATDSGGGLGQYTIGSFIADALTDTFTLTSANVGIAAVQVRDVTGVWSGAAGSNWNATDGNFTGGQSYGAITSLATPVSTVYFGDTDGLKNAVTNRNVVVDAGGLNVGSIVFQHASTGAPYVVSGGPINLAGDVTKSNTGVSTINSAIAFAAGSTHTFENATGSTLLRFGGAITGTGVTLNLLASPNSGDGNINLGNNSYTGTTNVLRGRINTDHTNAFGTSAVNVGNLGEAFLSTNGTYNNNFTLNGGFGYATNPGDGLAIRFNTATLAGSVTLAAGTDSPIGTNGGTGTITGKVTGTGALTIGTTLNTNNTVNRIVLSNTTNDWSGGLSINRTSSVGSPAAVTVLQLGASDVITNSNSVTFKNGAYSVLDLSGRNETVDLLSSAATGDGKIINSATGASILTIGGGTATTATFSGAISNTKTIAAASGVITETGVGGALSLVKIGSGTQILSGQNTYTGGTTVTGGTLALRANSTLATTGAMTLNGGTLDAGTFLNSMGVLSLQAASTIHLDPAGALAFADSDTATWNSNLTVTGTFVPGDGGSLRFGTDATGLTTAQLSQISISGYSSFTLSSQGYLIGVVPEPSAVFLSGLGLLGLSLRRRRA